MIAFIYKSSTISLIVFVCVYGTQPFENIHAKSLQLNPCIFICFKHLFSLTLHFFFLLLRIRDDDSKIDFFCFSADFNTFHFVHLTSRKESVYVTRSIVSQFVFTFFYCTISNLTAFQSLRLFNHIVFFFRFS